MSDDAAAQAEQLIPSTVRMISGCRDEQTSADVSNVASFSLPDPAGKAGGACTSAMLKLLYADKHKPDVNLSFQNLLLGIRDILSTGKYTQIPQLTSSRTLDISQDFFIVPENFSGTRYAVMIGINYTGQQGELSGCHNDVNNMKDYIIDVHGFTESNITLLLDDGTNTSPTYENIINAYKTIVSQAKSGDVVFLHYSGHGGKLKDDNSDDTDGYDETLVPLDYESAGQIRDDILYSTLIGPMKSGVTVTSIMDCCHSGTVLDLPYVFIADGEHTGMEIPANFNFGKLQTYANLARDIYQNPEKLLTDKATQQAAIDAAQAAAACCIIL